MLALSLAIGLGIGISSPCAETIAERFPPPQGYKRCTTAPGSFGASLRDLRLQPEGIHATDWRGREVLRANQIGGVLDRELLGKVEQCADVAIRLVAEFALRHGGTEKIAFRSLSGDTIRWSRWQHGRYATNAAVTRIVYQPGAPELQDGVFPDYLRFVMAYANTRSLERDWEHVDESVLQIGDVLIQRPDRASLIGHLSIIADACTDSGGKRRFIFVDGYLPARLPVVRQHYPDDAGSVWMTVMEYFDYMKQHGAGVFRRVPRWCGEIRTENSDDQ